MGFWERIWKEREDEVCRRFGPTDPPNWVHSFSWNDLRLPGGCALVFPPVEKGNDPRGAWHERNHWLYLTLGLTQPLNQQQMQKDRDAGRQYSSYGFELGILTDEKCDWPTQALYLFATHVTEGVQLKWGDRFGFGLRKTDAGDLAPFAGRATSLGLQPASELRAMLFWPYLLKDSSFVTSTGKAMIFVATGITEDEWALAKATTTAHLLLLLCHAGIGQRTIPERQSVLSELQWRQEWRRIESLGGEQAHAEVEQGQMCD
jgi:hypothetical protein